MALSPTGPLSTWLALSREGAVGTTSALAGLDLAPAALPMLAVTLVCILLWITTPVPPSFTGLLGLALVGLVLSTEVALVGFRSPATWLIVAGLVIGEATRRSDLADWLGSAVTGLVPATARTDPRRAFRWLLGLFCLVGLGLTLLVPSSLVRVLLLLPVLTRAGRFFEDRRPRVGLVLGPALTTFFASVGVLTASLPNVVVTGIVESAGGPAITWSSWGLHLFVVMGVCRAALVAGVAYWLYRPAPDANVTFEVEPEGAREATGLGAASPAARRMLAFLLLGTAVWATDFVHGLHPVYGAFLVALLATAPRVGVVGFDAVGDVDFSIVFFVGAVFAIGEGLTRVGVVDAATTGMLSVLPGDGSLPLILLVVFGVTLVLMFLIEGLAVASVLTPLLVSYAQGASLPLVPVVMVEAIALGTYFFPYQSIVLVGLLSSDLVETRDLVRTTAAGSVVTTVALLPVQLAVFAWLYG